MSAKLALVLPGGGYTPLGPAIRFPVLVLEQLGYEVRDVAYPALDLAADPFPWDELSAATAGFIGTTVGADQWDETIVVAKSLGTGVLAWIGDRLELANPRAIWLTPLFRGAPVRERAIALGWPSLLVAGTADGHHDPAGFDEVAHGLDADTLLIDRAEHGLEIPGDALATVAAMRRLVETTLAFAKG